MITFIKIIYYPDSLKVFMISYLVLTRKKRKQLSVDIIQPKEVTFLFFSYKIEKCLVGFAFTEANTSLGSLVFLR